MKILIKSGKVINSNLTDIYIQDGKIVKSFDVDKDVTVIDATGKYVSAGLVDMHCHLREPGYEYKETIETGTKSAVAGGFSTVACMPNTSPVIDNKAVVRYIQDKANTEGVANVLVVGSITKGLEGKELSEIGELKKCGVVAISDDGRPVSDNNLMRRAMEYAKMFDMPVISHCEDLALVDGGVINEGYMSTYLGLRGICDASEENMVSREILLAKTTGAKVHIAHVSTRGSVELIRKAKADGIKITCETAPHYFSLDESRADDFYTNAKINPPLRTKTDVEAIIGGLKDGTIDVIATDHAPHHNDEKNVEFEQASNGTVGFETALAVGITYLVEKGHIALETLIEKMTTAPSKVLNINKGTINVGDDADVCIFDMGVHTVNAQKLVSKSKNTVYDGMQLKGKVHTTIVNGKIVWQI